MLNRCSPRSRTSAVSGNGSASSSAAPFFPVKNATSSCSVPGATVSSTSGRALEPFLKNTLSRSGIAFGELCMSWRHADSAAAATATAAARRKPVAESWKRELRLNFAYLAGVETFEKIRGALAIELRVDRFHEQE